MGGKITSWISSAVRGEAGDTVKLPHSIQNTINLLRYLYGELIGDNCPVHAKSLTYTTLLSIVPLFVVVFSLFDAFGGLEDGKERLIGLISENLVAGQDAQIIEYITNFSENLKSGTVSVVGIFFLLWVAISFLSTIERSFNQIWDVRQQRPFRMRFLLFWFMVSVGPILLVFSISMSATVLGTEVFKQILSIPVIGGLLTFLIPFIPTCIFFSALYWFMPNTRVTVKAALTGGIVGGVLFEIVKVLFALYVGLVASSKYGRIYGSMAAIPIFMISLYVSWIIVLFGAEVSYVTQHFGVYKERRARLSNVEVDPYIAIRLVYAIAEPFSRGGKRLLSEELVRKYGFPYTQVVDLLDRLEQGEILCRVEGKKLGYIPARSLDTISVGDVVEIIKGKNLKVPPQYSDKVSSYLQEVFQRFNDSTAYTLDTLSFQKILRDVPKEE